MSTTDIDTNDYLFTIDLDASGESVRVHAFDAEHQDPQTGHRRIDVVCEVTRDGETLIVFPRGSTWCAVNRWTSVDGDAARALVCSLMSMRPGDTDSDYFASYTEDQLAFADRHGEDFAMMADRIENPEEEEPDPEDDGGLDRADFEPSEVDE